MSQTNRIPRKQSEEWLKADKHRLGRPVVTSSFPLRFCGIDRYNCAPYEAQTMRTFNLLAAIVIMAPVFMVGQGQYKVLWSLAGAGSGDGGQPVAGLVFDKAENLYGTTRIGGNGAPRKCATGGCGTVFELSPNGDGTWAETVLYVFCSHYVDSQCIDGAWPQGDLLLDGAGNLYGITNGGGKEPCSSQSIGCGTVFKLSKPQAPGAPWTEK